MMLCTGVANTRLTETRSAFRQRRAPSFEHFAKAVLRSNRGTCRFWRELRFVGVDGGIDFKRGENHG
jgi:hypothetical protein